MKKLLSFVLVAAFSVSMAFAQTSKTEKKAKGKKAPAAAAQADPAGKTVEPGQPAAAGPLKKDGTPDKRYKANKQAADKPVTGPTKKDGTPDMRYKANKDAAKKAEEKK